MRPSLLLAVLAVVSWPTAASAWELRTDSEGDLVRWTKKVELVLELDAAKKLGERDAELAIRAAVEHLDAHTPGVEVSLRVGPAKPMGYVVGAPDNQNSILVLDDWPYAQGTLAVTLVTLNARTNELLDADVAFNVEEHQFRVLPENARSDDHRWDDIQNTVTHELGHVLGLMHATEREDLVMYPSAPPGELVKRVLKGDDKDGLLALYSEPVAPPAGAGPAPLIPNVGCSASPAGSASPALVLLVLGFLLWRAPRRAVRWAALSAAAPALVLASEPAPTLAPKLPPEVVASEQVAMVQVIERRSLVHPRHPGLIVTELTVAPVECLKGHCGPAQKLVVLGGRVGDLEQVAVHEPVPQLDARVLALTSKGRTRVLWVKPEVQREIIDTLRLAPRSAPTQGSVAPPTGTAQVREIAR